MKKIANSAQRARNRTLWKRDLRRPEREATRCNTNTIMRHQGPDQPAVQFWCAGGRALQLLIDHPDMLDSQHPDLHNTLPISWAFGEFEPDQHDAPYPRSASAIPDVNLSAFDHYVDIIEQAYGVDSATVAVIQRANDLGEPMRAIARLIP